MYCGQYPCCGTTGCDLQTSTCCVDQFANGTCVAHSKGCSSLQAAFMCSQQSDCQPGYVCCGQANSVTQKAGTSCQMVPDGGVCPGTTTATSGSAQVCQTACECKNGQRCIQQACQLNTSTTANLTMCGLQAQAPFNCTMR